MKLKYHRLILHEALHDLVTPEALDVITSANLGQDALHNQIGHDAYHFDNNAFQAGWRFVWGQGRLIPAALRRRRPRAAWQAFGRLSHALQDFYAHSNYVLLWLERQHRLGRAPAPDQIEPADPEILYHSGLRSGKLYYPLEVLSFLPFVRRLVLPFLPRDSHAHMNLDGPESGPLFPYALQAGIRQTRAVFRYLQAGLKEQEANLFRGKSRII